MAAAPAAAAASATLTEPNTLVLTPSPQSCSSSGTCLSAAAWNTMSGRKSATRRKMRSRSRMSARRPSIRALACLAASISSTACSAGSEFSITSTRAAPKVTMRSQISAPIDPPPPVTMIDLPSRRLRAGGSRSSRRGRSSRSSTLTGARRSASPPSSSDGSRLVASPSRRARIRMVSGLASGSSALGVSTSRVTRVPRLPRSATMRSRSSTSPSTGTPRIAWPRSAGDGERMPTGRILVTAPLSIARSSTSASAARPSTRIGADSPTLACCSVRV